ncbi:hypothetical protein A2899_00265 [Candidatus Amesbacteria bacterium RIFCSPLOWO2_01_FULL_49_25]|uniref:Uncharacterized protein n=1 Tax=Candidatus Amesbacteria bacterium RIFCSPHIGHO2_01_FULL_48_32b TaxID=1797253 RepID=A0A1F4YH76_9BACT|nr:MAG: hypothetical protein A2876_05010 [Candidatus Amesbacteria bacterium RIFCSPHIGHO2_01_FULL_48_32b]OGD07055.1 MAG: hypothetical protein A2899_00265 [Candidatus Amesbacteria bacterium RIFCSPLOWO2_01_FULL_49_25]
MIPEAGLPDYVARQGGMPTVETRGKLTIIIHDYPSGGGLVVTSHHSVEHYGTAILQGDNALRLFLVALLREFHGDPCERQSLTNGGHPYDRF